MRTFLRGKIHRAAVTGADMHYEGSISLDPELMRMAGISVHEQVHVLNISNAERIITYAIEGRPGEVCLNGAAARLFAVGDRVIVLCYETRDDDGTMPWVVVCDDQNRRIA